MTSIAASTGHWAPAAERPLAGFRLLGREIASDFPLQDLARVAARRPAVTIRACSAPFPPTGSLVRQVCDGTAGGPVIEVYEGATGIQYHARDVGWFWIEASGRAVWYRREAGARAADIEHVLAGPVLGLALQVQGQVQLHASAVVIDGRAVAFAAPHGMGKSTLAASFVRARYALLSDDVLPLSDGPGGFTALHSLPRIKLWGDSLSALGEEEDRYDLVLSRYSKRRVTIDERWGSLIAEEAPLGAVYLLAPHADPRREIEFSPLKPATAALQLVANTYLSETLRGQRAANALDAAARLAGALPVRSVSYYRGYAELPALRAAIIADVQAAR